MWHGQVDFHLCWVLFKRQAATAACTHQLWSWFRSVGMKSARPERVRIDYDSVGFGPTQARPRHGQINPRAAWRPWRRSVLRPTTEVGEIG